MIGETALSKDPQQAEDVAKPGMRIALSVSGALRFAVTCALSWAFVTDLMPVHKPIENGLEMLFPVLVVLLLGLPSMLIGVGLICRGATVVSSALRMDILVVILSAAACLLGVRSWIAYSAMSLSAVDALFLRVCLYRLR